jgi:hypothetical protein
MGLNQEVMLTEDSFLVSETDSKGNISCGRKPSREDVEKYTQLYKTMQ